MAKSIGCVLLVLLLQLEALGLRGHDLSFSYQRLLDNSVMPDWIDAYGSEVKVKLNISYKGGIEITPNGVLLCQPQTQVRPHVTISSSSSSSSSSLFTLLMLDPDGLRPEEPTWKNVVHWMVTNIPSSPTPQQQQEEIWESGMEVIPYYGPHVRLFGLHRYYFLLFQQEDYIHVPKDDKPIPIGFSVRNFTKAYNLGYPLDGALFLTKTNESYS